MYQFYFIIYKWNNLLKVFTILPFQNLRENVEVNLRHRYFLSLSCSFLTLCCCCLFVFEREFFYVVYLEQLPWRQIEHCVLESSPFYFYCTFLKSHSVSIRLLFSQFYLLSFTLSFCSLFVHIFPSFCIFFVSFGKTTWFCQSLTFPVLKITVKKKSLRVFVFSLFSMSMTPCNQLAAHDCPSVLTVPIPHGVCGINYHTNNGITVIFIFILSISRGEKAAPKRFFDVDEWVTPSPSIASCISFLIVTNCESFNLTDKHINTRTITISFRQRSKCPLRITRCFLSS